MSDTNAMPGANASPMANQNTQLLTIQCSSLQYNSSLHYAAHMVGKSSHISYT